jgi:uncharacterized protein (TIGR02246 family)
MTKDEPTTDEQQIRDLAAEWRRAAEENDLDAILALMTEDAVFLTADRPPMTVEQFAAGFRLLAGNVQLRVEQTFEEIVVAGDLAYAWSHLTVVMTTVATGARARRSGDVLTIFRKSPTGAWLLSRDANLLPPAAERKPASSRAEKVEVDFEPAPELEEAVLAESVRCQGVREPSPPGPLPRWEVELPAASVSARAGGRIVLARSVLGALPWIAWGTTPPLPEAST